MTSRWTHHRFRHSGATEGGTRNPGFASIQNASPRDSRLSMTKQPAVYMLASKLRGTLYLGVTSELIARVWQHRSDVVEGFTRRYRVHRLVYFEQFESMVLAIEREKELKKWRRAWKVALIERDNPQWLDLWPSLVE